MLPLSRRNQSLGNKYVPLDSIQRMRRSILEVMLVGWIVAEPSPGRPTLLVCVKLQKPISFLSFSIGAPGQVFYLSPSIAVRQTAWTNVSGLCNKHRPTRSSLPCQLRYSKLPYQPTRIHTDDKQQHTLLTRQVLPAVNTEITVFRYVTTCSLVDRYPNISKQPSDSIFLYTEEGSVSPKRW